MALEASPPMAEALVAGQARRQYAERGARAPAVDPVLAVGLDELLRTSHWVIRRLEPAGAGAVENQADAALGISGGEQRRHRPALGRAEQHRALAADGVHHRKHVVHPL